MSFLAAFIHRQFFYTPPIPTLSFKDRTVIVTGSSSGLGLEASRWLVKLGAAKVILACRNLDKGKAAAKDIQLTTSCSPKTLEVWHLDMSSYASVLSFADRARTELPRLDVLLGNAGIGTRTFRVTEGNEETMTTNVISLFLLGFLLHPKLHETATKFNTQTHFTVTASELYQVAKFKERDVPEGQIFATLNNKSKADMGDRYNVSKLIEILMVKQMAVLSPANSSNVIVNCVAPGFCSSSLAREIDSSLAFRIFKKLFARTAEVGSRTLVHGASVGGESHGMYVPDTKITTVLGLAGGKKGEELRGRVWGELRGVLEGIREGATAVS